MEKTNNGLLPPHKVEKLEIEKIIPIQYEGVAGKVRVVYSISPILKPIIEDIDSGLSVKEIAEGNGKLSPDQCKYQVNGIPVEADYVPETSDVVLIYQAQEGVVEAIIITAVVMAVIGLAVGYFLYKNMPEQGGPDEAEKLQRITGARNEPKPYEPWNVILGERRVVPAYQAQPYTYWKGDEQYLKMLFNVGYGPLQISDMKVGDQPMWTFNDITTTILDWNTNKDPNTIRNAWPADIVQEDVGLPIEYESGWIKRTVPEGTRKVTLNFFHPAGLYRQDGSDRHGAPSTATVGYYDNGWVYVAPYITNTSVGNVTGSVVKDGSNYYAIYTNNPKKPKPLRDLLRYGPVYTLSNRPSDYYKKTCAVNITPAVKRDYGGRVYVDFSGYRYCKISAYRRWEATNDQFSGEVSFVPLDVSTGALKTGAISVTMTGPTWSFDPGVTSFTYTSITAERAFKDNDYKRYFGIDEASGRYPVLIALDIKASEQLSGVINNLSVKARTLVPNTGRYGDWSNHSIYGGWVWTKNPASMYKWVLQGPFNPVRVANSKIDNASLNSWGYECSTRGWECAELINYKSSLKQILNDVASTGRAEMSFSEGQFSVNQFKEQPYPKQIFTPKNSSDFSSKRQFSTPKKGIKYKFENADFEDQIEEAIWYDPSIPYSQRNESGEFESVELWGITNPTLARKHARFMFYEGKYRREVYELKTDVESLVVKRGDRVKIAHDVIDVGQGQGFIKSVGNGTITIDEENNLTTGDYCSLQVRTVSGLVNLTGYYQGEGVFNVYGSLYGVVERDLVVYGTPGKASLDCIVTEIAYGDDFTATLTLLNYAPEMFNYDRRNLDAWTSNFTTGLTYRPQDVTPLPPIISASTENLAFDGGVINVSAIKQWNDRAQISAYTLQYRVETDDPDLDVEMDESLITWVSAGVSPANEGMFEVNIPLRSGNRYRFRAKSVNSTGMHSDWSSELVVELQDNPAPDIENFTVTEQVDTPRTPDGMYSTLTIEAEEPTSGDYLYSIVEYRLPEQDEWFNISRLGWKYPSTAEVQVLANGTQYEIRVRSVSTFGKINEQGISKLFTTTNVLDPEYNADNPFKELPAPNVTGLELFEQGNDDVFTGKDAKFTWRKASLNDWVEMGYEGLKGASMTALDQYFRDYEVSVIADGEVVRTEQLVDNLYTYSHEKNAEDYKRMKGVDGAFREFALSVILRTRQNVESEKPAVLNVSNPAPSIPTGIKIVEGFRTISLNYNRPVDLDFSGVEVWVGTVTGFDLNDDTLVYDGPDTEAVIGGLETNTTYYITLRPYDLFGKIDIFSAEFQATTLKITTTDLDETVPDKVLDVAAVSAVYDSRLQSTSYIDVTWSLVNNTRVANYTLDINNGESQYTVAGTSFRFTDAIPGEAYTFKVRANSFASIEGVWSDAVTINADVSNVAPAVITGASVSGGLEKVIIEWTNPASENFYSIGIYRSTVSTFTPSEANKIASVVGAIGSVQRSVDTDVVNGTTYHYKLVPETLGGVSGAIVNAGSAIPFKISAANVDAYFESAAIEQAYIGDLDAEKITAGFLSADRIQGGTITGEKIEGTTLSAIKADMGTLTAGSIRVGAASPSTTYMELSTVDGIKAFNGGVQTLHFKQDGTGYIGASQDISWDGAGNVNVSGELGATSIFTNGQIKAVNNGVEVVVGAKDFGVDKGVYLLSGTDSAGELMFGVDTEGGALFGGELKAASGTFTGTLVGVDGEFSGTLAADTISFNNVIAGSFNYLDTRTVILSSSNIANGTNITFDVGEYKRTQSFKVSVTITQIAGKIYAANNTNTKEFTTEVRWKASTSASTGDYILNRTVTYPRSEYVEIYKEGSSIWSGTFAKTISLSSSRYITVWVEGDTFNTQIETGTKWQVDASIDISFI